MPHPKTAGPKTTKPDGEKPARTWWRLVVSAAIVLLVAQWGDRQLRQHEFVALLDRSARAQTTATDAARRVLSTREYTMPLLTTSSSATVRAGLEQLIENDAAKAALNVRAARDQLAGLDVLPWHSAVRTAEHAELAYLNQRIADFDQVAAGADLSLLDSRKARAAATFAVRAIQQIAPDVTAAHHVNVVFELSQ